MNVISKQKKNEIVLLYTLWDGQHTPSGPIHCALRI